MTPRERLLAPFRGIKPDAPAWLADLTYWYSASKTRGTLDSRYEGDEGYRLLHEDLGVCCYYHRGASTFAARHDGVEAETVEEGGQRTQVWKTPAGELTTRWRYLEKSCCWARVDYAVKTAADLKVLQDIFSRARHEPKPERFREATEYLGESGVPISAVPRSPIPALLADWCGVMNTAYLVCDETNAVEDTLRIIDQANDAAFECAVASQVELFHFCDNLDSSGSGSYFGDYMEEYYRRRLGQLHAVGKVAVVHVDGRLRGLLPKLAACGFDGIESVTPAPVGDVKIPDLREVVADDKTILWGGIPGAMFAEPWTDDDIRKQTRLLLDSLWAGGKLVVGSADQIPPDGNIDFCRAVAETIEEVCLDTGSQPT